MPASTRVTVPTTRSPFLPANSLKTVSRFGLADLLDDHLLGRLGGDPAERLGVEFHLAVAGDDVAGGLVDGDEDAFLDAEVPLGGDLDGGRDAVEDGFAWRFSAPRGACPRV